MFIHHIHFLFNRSAVAVYAGIELEEKLAEAEAEAEELRAEERHNDSIARLEAR